MPGLGRCPRGQNQGGRGTRARGQQTHQIQFPGHHVAQGRHRLPARRIQVRAKGKGAKVDHTAGQTIPERSGQALGQSGGFVNPGGIWLQRVCHRSAQGFVAAKDQPVTPAG